MGSVRHPLTRALLALTFTTGLVDAVSYLALGHVFAANMTGNIVLLGFGMAGSGGLPVLAPVISLATFLLGAGTGGVSDILHEGLTVAGWVSMWRPMEVFLYAWWPIVGDRRLYDRLSRMRVRVEPVEHS